MNDVFAQPALFTIMDGMVAMFNQNLSNGLRLYAASDTIQEPLPSINFLTGSFTTSEFDRWDLDIAWDIPAVVKIEGTAEDPGDMMRHVIEDIFRILIFYRGLPLKEKDGELVLTSWNDPEGTAFCNRGGPYLASFRMRPEEPGTSIRSADLLFKANYLANYEPSWEHRPIKKIVLGVNVFDPNRFNSLVDKNNWVMSEPDVAFAWGVYQKPDTLINYINPAPQVPSEAGDVVGPLKLLSIPATASVTHFTNQQFTAVFEHKDGVQDNVTNQVVWSTTVPGASIGASTGLFGAGAANSGTVTAKYTYADGTQVQASSQVTVI